VRTVTETKGGTGTLVRETSRQDLWKLSTRSVVYMAIGAALYGVLNLITNSWLVPGTQNISLRPGIVIPIFFGVLFGPIVGFFTGFIGNLLSDQLTYGIYWNWEIGNGLIGLIAGLTPLVVRGAYKRWPNVVTAAVASAIGIVIGLGVASITDQWLYSKISFNAAVTTEWVPGVVGDILVGIPLLVILLAAWARVRERASR
jgi:energy-coupling factor transport system substrate-specific component